MRSSNDNTCAEVLPGSTASQATLAIRTTHALLFPETANTYLMINHHRTLPPSIIELFPGNYTLWLLDQELVPSVPTIVRRKYAAAVTS